MNIIISIFIFILLYVFGNILLIILEYKYFNKGLCTRCNTKLNKIKTDSSARYYKCPNCNHTTECYYNITDKNY